MDQQLKQRLVGAIVLVAMAVIFIPMLLDGGPVEGDLAGGNIPPRPERLAQQFPLAEPQQKAKSVTLDASQGAKMVSEAPSGKVAAEPTSAPTVASVRETVPEPASKSQVADKSSSAKSSAPDDMAAWDVQVASLSSKKNAQVLRDKLRKKDHPAFIERVANKGVYRVRIGPVLGRQRAESIVAAVKASHGLKGIIVRRN